MGTNAHPGQKGREKNAHQLQTALAYTHQRGHAARICETLDCGIMDVIELASDEPSTTGGNDNGAMEPVTNRNCVGNKIKLRRKIK